MQFATIGNFAKVSGLQLLRPDLVLEGSVLQLTPEFLAQHGLRGLILDVDETLIPCHTRQISSEIKQWIEQLRPHTTLWLVTNNWNLFRIRQIAEDLRLPYLWGARKPSPRKLREAAQAMNLPPENVAMVGDRLFTDVLAGNRLGMFTILVDPINLSERKNNSYWVRQLELWIFNLCGGKAL